MNLDKVKQQTTWNDASGSINTNFEKIRQAILALQAEGGGLDEAELEEFLTSHGYTKQEWVLAQNALLEERIENLEQEGGAVNVEGSEFVNVDEDGTISLEIDPQGGLGQTEQGLGIVDIPSHLLEGINIDVDSSMSDTSENAVANKVIKKYVDGKAEQAYEQANEYTNEEIASLREELQSGIDHPVFVFEFDSATNKATAEMVAALAEAIADNKLILCNGRTYKFILEQDGMYGLVSDAYMDITDGKLKASVLAVMSSSYDVQLMEEEVPVGTEITEETVRGWGFTKNAGTITGIKMNGATKGTSGVVDLGDVLTEHQKLKTINNQSIVGEGNITIQGGGATPRVEMTAESASIEPNKFYVWGNAERLNLTLAEGKADELNRYMFQFKTPSSAYTILQLPDDIMWSDDTKVDADGMPVIELSAYHRVEIIDGLATLRRWRIVSRYIVFADPEVEKVLLANGIGDGVGVTKKAASALTTLYGEFAHNELITSFDEFSLFGVTTINGAPSSEGGFCGCTNLKSIVLPETLEVMYDGAVPGQYLSTGVFKDCESLKRITIPSKVTVIPTSAFYNCISLKNVEFKGDIKSIGAYAFALCENLSVNIPSSVEYINDFAFRDAPMTDAVIDCPNLRELSGIDVFTHSELKSAKSLGNITTLTFQNDPPSYYGRYPSFYGCTKLEEVNLPETLMHIGRNMFQGCASLRNVTIPHKITELYTGTFYGCDSLEWVKLMPNTPPTLGSVDCFDETASYLFYVPDDSVEAYKTAGNWNSYARRIKGMSEFVMAIVCPSSIKGDSMVISAINVTGDLTWSIQNGSDYATITEDGYLEILPTASNSPVTIRCTQSDGNYVEKIVNVTYNAALMYLPFDADFVDAKGNATLQNVSECNIDGSKGKRGASMHRPNTYGGLAYAPNFNASFSAKSFTIDVWVYLPSSAPLSYLGIAGKRTNAGMGASWSVGINQRRVNIGLSASGAGFTNDFYTEAVIPYNRWTRVTIIRDVDKGEIRVYVNTELVATFGMTYALFDGTDGLAVGNYHTDTSNDYFVGNLDEFYLYEGCIFE